MEEDLNKYWYIIKISVLPKLNSKCNSILSEIPKRYLWDFITGLLNLYRISRKSKGAFHTKEQKGKICPAEIKVHHKAAAFRCSCWRIWEEGEKAGPEAARVSPEAALKEQEEAVSTTVRSVTGSGWSPVGMGEGLPRALESAMWRSKALLPEAVKAHLHGIDTTSWQVQTNKPNGEFWLVCRQRWAAAEETVSAGELRWPDLQTLHLRVNLRAGPSGSGAFRESELREWFSKEVRCVGGQERWWKIQGNGTGWRDSKLRMVGPAEMGLLWKMSGHVAVCPLN